MLVLPACLPACLLYRIPYTSILVRTRPRFVAIALGLTCIGLSLFNWYFDCRVFVLIVDVQRHQYNSTLKNFTKSVDGIFNAFGVDSVPNVRTEFFNDEQWSEFDVVFFGVHSFTPVDSDDAIMREFACIEYVDIGLELTGQEQTYYNWVNVLAHLTPSFGFLGVVCATVEMFFCVFYPSIIAGAIFLSLAAFTEMTWLAMYVVDLRKW